MQKKINIKSGNDIARCFKYYSQNNKLYLKFKQSFDRIQAKTFYNNNKKFFDYFYTLFSTNNVDIENYLYYFIIVLRKTENDLKQLLSKSILLDYDAWSKQTKKNYDIYLSVLNTAKFIAEETIRLGYLSSKDFIRYIYENKLISQYFISGKISEYYLAAIPNFKKIIPKLDLFSKADLQFLYDKFELYNLAVTNAFLKTKNIKVNPIKITDNFINMFKSNV